MSELSIPFLISVTAAVAAVLSWRSAEITTIQDKEQLLHQRHIDSNNLLTRGEYSLLNPIRLRTWPDNHLTATLSKYVTGTEPGSVEITIVGKGSSIPSKTGFENHPWNDAVNADIAAVEPYDGTDFDFVLSVLIYTTEPKAVQDQLIWLEMMTDHVCGGVETDDISDSPSKQGNGLPISNDAAHETD